MVADPASQIVVDPLMLLVHDRRATGLLVNEIAAPTSTRTLHAALEVCELAAGAGRFGGTDATRLGVLVRGHLTDNGLPSHLRQAAADLIARLTPGGRPRPAGDPTPARASAVAALTTSAETALDVTSRGTSAGENRMLVRLVDELLFSQQVDVRLGAAAVLAASPFGKPLADTLADGNQTLTGEYACALSTIGGAEHRPALEAVLAERVPPAVTVQAAFGLGNLPGRTDPAVLRHAIHRHDSAKEVLRALVYAAGMQRATSVLSEVRARPGLPAEVRAAAGWWLARPTPAPE